MQLQPASLQPQPASPQQQQQQHLLQRRHLSASERESYWTLEKGLCLPKALVTAASLRTRWRSCHHRPKIDYLATLKIDYRRGRHRRL
jgi:hypothetical protein